MSCEGGDSESVPEQSKLMCMGGMLKISLTLRERILWSVTENGSQLDLIWVPLSEKNITTMAEPKLPKIPTNQSLPNHTQLSKLCLLITHFPCTSTVKTLCLTRTKGPRLPNLFSGVSLIGTNRFSKTQASKVFTNQCILWPLASPSSWALLIHLAVYPNSLFCLHLLCY